MARSLAKRLERGQPCPPLSSVSTPSVRARLPALQLNDPRRLPSGNAPLDRGHPQRRSPVAIVAGTHHALPESRRAVRETRSPGGSRGSRHEFLTPNPVSSGAGGCATAILPVISPPLRAVERAPVRAVRADSRRCPAAAVDCMAAGRPVRAPRPAASGRGGPTCSTDFAPRRPSASASGKSPGTARSKTGAICSASRLVCWSARSGATARRRNECSSLASCRLFWWRANRWLQPVPMAI